LKNSIQVEPVLGHHNKIKFSARTDLKPFGFIVFLALTFIFFIGAIYMYMIIKKARKRTINEMQFMVNLSASI
jgi:heme/copper-type cytochrome/quinol oxidase subunit 3